MHNLSLLWEVVGEVSWSVEKVCCLRGILRALFLTRSRDLIKALLSRSCEMIVRVLRQNDVSIVQEHLFSSSFYS